ncbi:MAG: AGE family epimerase/isomerase, partial [Acidimicrobiia bacterium]|nr:AGE family epimerase/isomerase [Acidimicrobiia bacterium]
MHHQLTRLRRAAGSVRRRAHIALVAQPATSVPRPATWTDRLERLLTENIIPFWALRTPGGPDGYPELFDDGGEVIPSRSRHIRTQARTLWVHSQLLGSAYGSTLNEEAARRGFDFIEGHFWDQRHGGFHSRLPLDGDAHAKHFYDHLMALDAANHFHRATGNQAAERMVADVLEILDKRFRDDGDGYIEGYATDWSPITHTASLLVKDRSHKTAASHINALNVLTSVQESTAANLEPELRMLLDIVDRRAVLPKAPMMGEIFTRDWSAVVGSPTVSYGHDLERVWMARTARELIGARPHSYEPVFDEVVRWGWDRGHGGFYFQGKPGRPAGA